jgi:type IV pilus assembly protein PilO
MSTMTQMRERLLSPVGLHSVGFGILAIATIVLGIRVGLDWRATSSSSQDAIASRQTELRTLTFQTAPLRGLDKKVAQSSKQIDDFYARRIPPNWSAVLERLGELKTKGPVQLTRVQYTVHPGSGDLTEIRMDAGLSGEYTAIMRFVNGLERSPTFFVIRAMALTGQQSGTVNLRLEFSTWLRPEDAVKVLPLDADPQTESPAGDGQGTSEPNAAGPGTASLRRGVAGEGL